MRKTNAMQLLIKILLVIDGVALLFVFNAANLLVDSVTLLFSGSAALTLVDSFLDSGALLLRNIATVWCITDTALGV